MTYSRLSREGVHSRVHSPAHHVDGSCPHRWARRVFQNSESDEARHGVPAHATPAHACVSRLVEPSALTHMLTRVCARDAQAMPRSSSPPPPPASSASLPPSPRAARRFQSPRRRRSDLVLMAAYVYGFRDHGREHRERVCPISACSFAGACSGCPWGAGEPARSTFARSCVRLRVVLGATLAPLGSRMRRCE
jgi:hypothetical protein